MQPPGTVQADDPSEFIPMLLSTPVTYPVCRSGGSTLPEILLVFTKKAKTIRSFKKSERVHARLLRTAYLSPLRKNHGLPGEQPDEVPDRIGIPNAADGGGAAAHPKILRTTRAQFSTRGKTSPSLPFPFIVAVIISCIPGKVLGRDDTHPKRFRILGYSRTPGSVQGTNLPGRAGRRRRSQTGFSADFTPSPLWAIDSVIHPGKNGEVRPAPPLRSCRRKRAPSGSSGWRSPPWR